MRHFAILTIAFITLISSHASGQSKTQVISKRDSVLRAERTFRLNDTNALKIYFTNGSMKLTPTSIRKLKYFVKNLDTTDVRKVVVEGWENYTMMEQQLSWEHINAVMDYLLDSTNTKEDRLIFGEYIGHSKRNSINIRYARPGESGCARCVVPPHPNMTYHSRQERQ